jgi:DNA processing protein
MNTQTANNELRYQIALTQIESIGPSLAKYLLDHFGNASAIFNASKKDLLDIEYFGNYRAEKILRFSNFTAADAEVLFVQQNKITPLFINDAAYPKKLAACSDAPTILYYKGSAPINQSRVISIVGTRLPSLYGKWLTHLIIEELAPYNPLIISGLAYGIDVTAHQCALDCNLQTVGVLAHSLATIYPAAHQHIAKDIVAQGGLLTELSSTARIEKFNFPKRNRIVAGLSDATIVIETETKGGSMITANLAFDYDRQVFACPGKITDKKSSGCLRLIQTHKAAMLDSVATFIEALGWAPITTKQNAPIVQQNLTDSEKTILTLLNHQIPVSIDEIYLKSMLSNAVLAGSLLNLELYGLIGALPGKTYLRLLG